MATNIETSFLNGNLSVCCTPVLLIGFNRPDSLLKVFEQIRIARPKSLYIAIDGPREGKEDERDLVNRCHAIVDLVDWSCDVHTLFREENRGCGYGPAEAISWAFENEDRLIVLEDDCVPSQSFFRFCDEMLERYKDDKRINIVSGRSHHSGTAFFENQDYIFTRYAHTWGWATWKRCWSEFDIKMSDFPDFLNMGGALNILLTKEEATYMNKWFSSVYNIIEEECTHSWDRQWAYARIKSGALGIVPSKNLIHNIGDIGTHSFRTQKAHKLLAEELPIVLRHPRFVLPNKDYESMHFHNHMHVVHPLHKRIYNRLMQWIKKD